MTGNDEEPPKRELLLECGLAALLLLGTILLLVLLHQAEGAEVKLGWNANPEPDIAGYVIAYGEERIEVGNVTEHTLELAPGRYSFTVYAVNAIGLESLPSVPLGHVVTDVRASTEAPAFPVKNAVDGKPETLFASFYEPQPPDPQWIEIDLGEARWVKGLRYLPRQDGWLPSGHVTGYQIYADGQRIVEGELTLRDAAEKAILFPRHQARRWRLQSSLAHLTCAEISVIETGPPMVRFSFQYGTDLVGWEDLPPIDRPKKERGFVRWTITELP